MKVPPPPVDVVFVAYHSARWVAPCLQALSRADYPLDRLHLILVDNAPDDPSEPAFKAALEELTKAGLRFGSTRSHAAGANLGCAGGNNVGWRLGESPYVLLLNLDTEPTPGFLAAMVAALEEEPQRAIAGSKIYFPDSRRLQHAGGMIYPNGMADHRFNGAEDSGQADEALDVDFVTGACLLARRSVLEALGGLDEDYNPAYYEETDLCLRARRAGWKVRYVPEALVYHHESAGLGGRADPRFLRAIYRGRMKFVVKNWTLADLCERWLPAERWWFGIVESREARPYQLRSYLQGLAFLLRAAFAARRRVERAPALSAPPPSSPSSA